MNTTVKRLRKGLGGAIVAFGLAVLASGRWPIA
jgi:hypothetical protein